MKNPLGSETFGTTQVRTDEYILLAQTMTENGISVEESVLHIEAIDDLLSLQKISSIVNGQRYTSTGRIRKNSSLSDIFNDRIGKLVEDISAIKNLIIIALLTLCSCAPGIESLNPPIIVVAIDPPVKSPENLLLERCGSAVLRDADGHIWSASGCDNAMARAIINSYKPGDTLR